MRYEKLQTNLSKNRKDFTLTTIKSTLEFKGEMLMLNVLRLQNIDIDLIEAALQHKHKEAPLFFVQSPLLVDCSYLTTEQSEQLDLAALRQILLKMDFVPIGLRGISSSLLAASIAAGWNLLRSSAKKTRQMKSDKSAPPHETIKKYNAIAEEVLFSIEDRKNTAIPVVPTPILPNGLTVKTPVRSGQQVYAKNGDLIVLAPTSAGSEIMADGSIHVYGPLRGRVLAGVNGDKTARIFCRSLEAELIVIAGCYQLLDESDTHLKGKPAMIRLEDEKLIIEPLN
jgi:septum site-determining protein MinC